MPASTLLYVGCYTERSAVGIRVFDATDPGGRITEISQVEGIVNPSFLAVHPNGRVLYAVSETASFDGGPGGGLVAFGVDPDDGSLVVIDQAPSHGAAPCYVSVDPIGRYVYAANYLSGSIVSYALESDGGFGELVGCHQHHGSGPTDRQLEPHAHCIVPGPDGDSVYAVDLGTDRIIRYAHRGQSAATAFGREGELVLEPGSGPRHLVFHPDEPVAFLACELDSTIVTLGYDAATGQLNRLATNATLPATFTGLSTAAEIRVHPNGRFIYVSNRGHDSIAVFGFSSPGLALELLAIVPSGGRTPRNFAVHPGGRSLLVANQDSDTIVPFRIDLDSGGLEPLDAAPVASQPVCLTFLQVDR